MKHALKCLNLVGGGGYRQTQSQDGKLTLVGRVTVSDLRSVTVWIDRLLAQEEETKRFVTIR